MVPLILNIQSSVKSQLPSHFEVELKINDEAKTRGEGHNKKAAEQQAAKAALKELE